MTIREVAAQLHHLSVGHINGSTYTKDALARLISDTLSKVPDKKRGSLMMIELPDGYWFFTVSQWGSIRDGFDYDIPENREQESRMIELFI